VLETIVNLPILGIASFMNAQIYACILIALYLQYLRVKDSGVYVTKYFEQNISKQVFMYRKFVYEVEFFAVYVRCVVLCGGESGTKRSGGISVVLLPKILLFTL
jgi:hypothetical protein